jgi:hypothetical protein
VAGRNEAIDPKKIRVGTANKGVACCAPTSLSHFSQFRRLPSREAGAEFSGGQIIQGAEAAAELGVAQAVLAIERSEKLFGGVFPLLRVEIHAARDEVAVGVAARLRAAKRIKPRTTEEKPRV